ncbi:MAG: endonuclease domain-containing protein [Candidatus Peribacteraceae bacterium]|nr:endonuclease domain-containing protein [Candidatus Peribacteraceae bacterium]
MNSSRQIKLAKTLRQRQTIFEARLWSRLRNHRFHGYKFRRQHPIGRWIADFACIDRKLVIELDGESHALQSREDAMRDEDLTNSGFFVLRFRNSIIKDSFGWCLQRILMALERDIAPPSPYPLPPLRRRERDNGCLGDSNTENSSKELDRILSQIKPEQLHGEQFGDTVVGRERWWL